MGRLDSVRRQHNIPALGAIVFRAEVFPIDSISPEFRGVTIDLLLSHHGGISAFDDTDAKDFKSIPRLSGTPKERHTTAKGCDHQAPAHVAGVAV